MNVFIIRAVFVPYASTARLINFTLYGSGVNTFDEFQIFKLNCSNWLWIGCIGFNFCYSKLDHTLKGLEFSFCCLVYLPDKYPNKLNT